MSPLLQVLLTREEAILDRWAEAWPADAREAARAVLARARAAVDGKGDTGGRSPLNTQSLRALRMTALRELGDGATTGAELFAFDAVFASDVVAREGDDAATTERLRFLAAAGVVLGSSLDYHETLVALARLAVPRLADWCSVEILGDDGLAHQLAVTHVDPAKVTLAQELRKKFPPNPTMTQAGLYKVLSTGESELFEEIPAALIDQIPDDEQRTLTRALGLRSGLVVPIRANGKVLGALSLVTAESGRRYTQNDLLLAREVADRAGLAIDNAALYKKAQDAIRAREDFLSIASHELRTPLTSLHLQISTLVAKAQQGLPATLTKEKLQRLDGQMARLRELVDQLLDVSRLATGRVAYNYEDADLKEVASAVVDELRDVAAAAGTALSLRAHGDTRGRWDRGRLEQVLTNLVGNAVKYGAGAPVDVEVAGRGEDVVVVVKDRGVGIAKEDLGRLFQRFERASSARNFSGLGLGLWISDQIVRGHGGRIAVESTLGAGATFTLTVPRRSVAKEP